MIEAIGLWVAKQLGSYAFKKGLDHLFAENDEAYQTCLAKVIDRTIDEYAKLHGAKDREGKFGFYKSQILIDELLRYRFFKNNDDINSTNIKEALSKNNNIIPPTEKELEAYLLVFNEELKKETKLKALAIEDGYKEEIFAISQNFYSIFGKLDNIEQKLDKTLANTEQLLKSIEKTDHNAFEKLVNKIPAEERRKSQSLSAFSYRSGQFDYVSRKEENELKAFCDDDRSFLWWAVTGRGGSGKSRMVYEFILQNHDHENWIMKFFPWDEKVLELEEWEYPNNLLLAIDYLTVNSEKIGQWFKRLCQNRPNKLRILLIERTGISFSQTGERIEPQWFQNLTTGGGNTMLTCLHKSDLLELNGSSRDMLVEIAGNYVQSRGRQVSSEVAQTIILDNLVKIDPEFERPLYVLFLADAWLAHGDDINHWDMGKLQDWINCNELKKLSLYFTNNNELDHDAFEAGKYLMAFATAVSELNLVETFRYVSEIKNQVDTIQLFERENKIKDQVLSALCCTNSVSKQYILQGIVPDIMGEYFCLNFLKELYDPFNEEPFLQFTENAWEYFSFPYFHFLIRLVNDFYSDPFVLNKMLRQPQNPDEIFRKIYCVLLLHLTANNPNEEISSFVERLGIMAEQFEDDEETQFVYAKALVNQSAQQQLEGAFSTVEKLEHLSSKYNTNAEIQVEFSCGLFNLLHKQKCEEAFSTLQRLEVLADHLKQNAEIQIIFAQGIVNLSIKQEDKEAVYSIRKLESLAKQFEEIAKIQLVYAVGLYNLCNKLELDTSFSFIAKLEALAGQFNDNEEIQVLFAQGLFSISAKQPVEAAVSTVTKLEALACQFKKNWVIQVVFAQGLFNLTSIQSVDDTFSTVARLEALASQYQENVEIQVLFAQGLFNLSAKQQVEATVTTVGKLEALANQFKENEEIQVQFTQGLFNLSNKQPVEAAVTTVAKLEALAGQYKGNKEIQVLFSKGLLNLSAKQTVESAFSIVAKLEALAGQYQENGEIQIQFAKGLFNLSKKQPVEEAVGTVRKLDALAGQYQENGEIQVAFAQGLVNLSVDQPLEEAVRTVGKLEALAGQYKRNEEILVQFAKGLVNLSSKQAVEAVVSTVGKLETLAGQFQGNGEILVQYGQGLFNLYNKQPEEEAAFTAGKLEYLTTLTDNKIIRTCWLFVLIKKGLGDADKVKEIYNDLVEFVNSNPNHPDAVQVSNLFGLLKE